jgi:hypothetical protein
MPRKTVTEADIDSLEFWIKTIRKLNRQAWDVQDHGNMLDRTIDVRCPADLVPKLIKTAERFGYYANSLEDLGEGVGVEIGQSLDVPFAAIERTARGAQEAFDELTDVLGPTPDTD